MSMFISPLSFPLCCLSQTFKKNPKCLVQLFRDRMGRESNEIAYSAVLRGQDGAEGTGEDIFKEGAENARAAAGT